MKQKKESRNKKLILNYRVRGGKKKRGMKKREESLRDSWDTIKGPISILCESQKEKREKEGWRVYLRK